MFGQVIVNILFAAALVSCGTYFWSLRPKTTPDVLIIARILFLVVVVGIVAVSAIQLYNILTYNYQYTYVWGHSSRELSKPLLIATFYAGQEGSFMLWTLLSACMGFMLLPYIRKHNYESPIMAFYTLILVFLLLMLVAKSPFALVWESFAKDGVQQGFMPPNGKGLNPLLQNIWITIHPPILFTGFAAMSVPFVFALAALIRRDYQQWIRVSLPWILFATAILGFGIMLGGFWAYETLGWGGFWGWDPVENSSLIPWLVSVALVHTMLTQKKTGGLIKTNLVLAILCFLMVLYSTFLTRSGVLGDTSVHSFVDPGFFAYVLLVVFMVVFATLGLGMLIWRRKDITNSKANFVPHSREFALAIGASLTMASAVIVVIGTSWPLIAELLKRPKVAIDVSFYNQMHLPLAIVITLVNAASLLLQWKSTSARQFLYRLRLPLLFSVVCTALTVVFGVHDPAFLALTFGAFCTLFVNLELTIRLLFNRPSFAGAYISHFGIAVLMLGIVATSRYSVTEHVRLPRGAKQQALGYSVMFVGREQIEKHYTDREKYKYYVELVKNDAQVAVVTPVIYWSNFNKRQSPFLEPGIRWSAVKDIYISPKAVELEGESPTMMINKNAATAMPLDSTITIRLVQFDMSNAVAAAQAGDTERLKLGVTLEVWHKGTSATYTLYTTFMGKEGIAGSAAQQQQEPARIAGTQYYLALQRILPNKENLSQSQALLAVADAAKPQTQPREVFTVELSHKPFQSLVWAGVILMTSGFFVSLFRRQRELRQNQTTQNVEQSGSPVT